jgi:hypothetical protein
MAITAPLFALCCPDLLPALFTYYIFYSILVYFQVSLISAVETAFMRTAPQLLFRENPEVNGRVNAPNQLARRCTALKQTQMELLRMGDHSFCWREGEKLRCFCCSVRSSNPTYVSFRSMFSSCKPLIHFILSFSHQHIASPPNFNDNE